MAAKILRLLCVFFSVFTVWMCGCTPKSEEAPPPPGSFRADFSAEYHGMRPAGTLTYLRQGVCTMQLTAPETLAGLRVRFQNSTLALQRGDAAATADEPYLPANSFPSAVFAALQAASNGSSDALELTAAGLPQLLRLPDGSAVTFLNAKALD